MLLISFSIGVAIAITCICNQNKLEYWLELQTLKRANRRATKTNATLSQLQANKAAAKERERGLIRDRVRVYRSIENAAKEGHCLANMGHYRIGDELKEELRNKGYTVDGSIIRW